MEVMNLGLENLNFGENQWSMPQMPAMNVFGDQPTANGSDTGAHDRDCSSDSEGDESRSVSSQAASFSGPAGRGVNFRNTPEHSDEPARGKGSSQLAGAGNGERWSNPPVPRASKPPDGRGGGQAAAGLGGFRGGLTQEQVLRDTRAGGLSASQAQLKMLEVLSEENKRLQELKKHYQVRLASSSIDVFAQLKQERNNLIPRIQQHEQGVLCEAQINRTMAITMEQNATDKRTGSIKLFSDTVRDVLKKEGNNVGTLDKLTVRKCWSTGNVGSATSAVRALGSVRHLVIDDCHRSMVLIDGVERTCKMTDCSQLTLVIGGDCPHFDITSCSDIQIISCATRGKLHEMCMSCCDGIVTSLITHAQYRSAVAVLDHRDDARVVCLPDTIEAKVEGNSVVCELKNSTSVPDECLPLTGDTTLELMVVDREDQLERIQLSSHEEHQHLKHKAHKQVKKPKLGRVQVWPLFLKHSSYTLVPLWAQQLAPAVEACCHLCIADARRRLHHSQRDALRKALLPPRPCLV